MGGLKNLFRFLFGLVFHNFITKLLCLLMAFVLYIYVNTSEDIDREVVLSIAIANRQPNLIVTSQSVSEARVLVNGPRAKMDQLKPDDLSMTLSLRDGQKPGELTFRLYPDLVQVPPGIRVRVIEPASVVLRLEPIVARTLEIRPVLEGAPREGYEVAEVRVSPATIEAAGPPSVLDELSVLETEVVDIEGTTGSFKQRVAFRPPNMVSAPARRSAIVAVTIRERSLQRTFEHVPIREAGGRTQVLIEPPQVSVQLDGPYSIVQSMARELLVPVVSAEGLAPGESARRPVALQSVPLQRVEVLLDPAEVLLSVPSSAPEPDGTEAEQPPAPASGPRPGRVSGREKP
jgi:hypothetical protein